MSLVVSGKYLGTDSMYAQHSRPSELKGIAIADLSCGGIFVKASVQDTVEAMVICYTYDSDNMSEYTVFDSGEVIEKLDISIQK